MELLCAVWGQFRSCFVEVAQRSTDLLMNLWGRKWLPHPIPLLSWDCPLVWEFIGFLKAFSLVLICRVEDSNLNALT